jgi:hypothetical protein
MAYKKDDLSKAKDQGIFMDNFDPHVLAMNEKEKQKLAKNLKNSAKSAEGEVLKEGDALKPDKHASIQELHVQLSFFEKVIAFFLAVFGIKTTDQFKLDKAIRDVEKKIAVIKPSLYNSNSRRITGFFAHRIHDLNMKLLLWRDIFKNTMDDEFQWEDPKNPKTVAEKLFERMVEFNSAEISNNFSVEGIKKAVEGIEDVRKAVDMLDKSLYTFVYGIEKPVIEQVNRYYTNLVYLKSLCEFDFTAFLRRFDPNYEAHKSPQFSDIPGDALVNYIKELEEAIFQMDLSIDNHKVLKEMFQISQEFNKEEKYQAQTQSDPENLLPEGNAGKPEITTEISALQEDMKTLAYNKVLSYIIQIIKKDPLYSPSFVHTKYDLFKLYVDILEKRIRLVARRTIKDNKIKKVEVYINKLFSNMQWVGIYTANMAEALENEGYIGFTHPHQIAVIYSYLDKYYNTILKNTINILLLNGSFMEKNFQKLVSETFYNMDKFIERFEVFVDDMQADGSTGKRLTKQLARKSSKIGENKNAIEKSIVHINGQAKDFYEEFSSLFSSVATIISRVFTDIESKPPKYIRNIRGIGGYQNSKFISSLQNGHNVMQMMQSIMNSFSQ